MISKLPRPNPSWLVGNGGAGGMLIIAGTLARLLSSLPPPDDTIWLMTVAGAYSLIVDPPVSPIKSSSIVVIQYRTTEHMSTTVRLLSAYFNSLLSSSKSNLISHQGAVGWSGQANGMSLPSVLHDSKHNHAGSPSSTMSAMRFLYAGKVTIYGHCPHTTARHGTNKDIRTSLCWPG